MKSLGATWIFITWEAPDKIEYPGATTSYEIRINNSHTDAGPLLLTTGNNETFFNVTGLLPGTAYELTVVAVSQVGDMVAKSGIDANFVVKQTEITGESIESGTAISQYHIYYVYQFSHTLCKFELVLPVIGKLASILISWLPDLFMQWAISCVEKITEPVWGQG